MQQDDGDLSDFEVSITTEDDRGTTPKRQASTLNTDKKKKLLHFHLSND